MPSNNVKRVAKNTIIMYIRMIVLIFIAFFASRLLLSTLGVEDFGVYSVVGSISASFMALKGLFSESLQRFLNVAKGKKENSIREQIAIFNTGVLVHLVLIVLFCFLVETIGLWLLDNKLLIPEGRIDAAHFVFHMTVISAALSIISIPYDALIISNEKMSVYALISIIDAVFKLLFIFLIPSLGIDYLVSYSAFLVTIPLSTLCFQIIYCRKFDECQYKFKIDRIIFKEVFTLSSWNFIGNISFSLIHEGINMLLNIYGGVVLNAARAVAYQVKNWVGQLSSNTMVAVRPRVMQMSVQSDINEYYRIICLISRISFMILLIVAVPFIVYCNELLSIWLKEVPPHSSLFCRLVLVGLIIRSLHEPLNIMNMAVGKIKRMMIIEACVMLFFFGLIFLSLKLSGELWMPFALMSVMEAFVVLFLVLNAIREIDFIGSYYMVHVIVPIIILSIIASFVGYLFFAFLQARNFMWLIVGFVSIIIIISLICYLFMDKKEKSIVLGIIKRK